MLSYRFDDGDAKIVSLQQDTPCSQVWGLLLASALGTRHPISLVFDDLVVAVIVIVVHIVALCVHLMLLVVYTD